MPIKSKEADSNECIGHELNACALCLYTVCSTRTFSPTL